MDESGARWSWMLDMVRHRLLDRFLRLLLRM